MPPILDAVLTTIQVTVHASQFPESVRDALLDGLRSRRIPPKFLYQSYKQAQLWLTLHRACSPAWLDPDAIALYDRGFETVAALVPQQRVNVIGLGCGGGHKEARLLRRLASQGKGLFYVPCDVSLPLLLASVGEAEKAVRGVTSRPLLCDLAVAGDLPEILESFDIPNARRIVTFFGMIPNFEPDLILSKLSQLMRADDLLLMSANLVPGADYRAGVESVLPAYDNPHTQAWLVAFLQDLGIDPDDGATDFSIEEASGFYRIVADFRFRRDRIVTVHEEQFAFNPGEVLRLFFSYRHTPETMRRLLQGHHFQIVEQWISASEEEGVFLARKKQG
jgi:L-histidine Nalpha-methyltransferase